MILRFMKSHKLASSYHVICTVNSYHEVFKAFIFLTVLINVGLEFRCHRGSLTSFNGVAIC